MNEQNEQKLNKLRELLARTDEKKLIKLQQLLSETENNILRQEFAEYFKQIIDFLTGLKAKNKEQVDKLNEDIKDLSRQLKKDNTISLVGLSNNFKQVIQKALKEQENGMNFIRDTVRKLKHGKDGKDADEERVAILASELALKLITPEQTADKLEELKGDARLKIEAIKDLKEKLEALEQRPLGRSGSGGGGLSKIALDTHFINDETPTGTVNGVNTDFVLAHAPNPSTSLMVYKDGQRMHLVDDFSFSGRTITFNVAPLTDSIIVVDYRK